MKHKHLGPVRKWIKLVTALVRLVYWLVKLATVTANYQRHPIANKKLLAEVPAP